MKRKNRWIPENFIQSVLLIGILCSQIQLIEAQTVAKVGTSAASFLKIGVGGRALGMGEAYTTCANDITSIFWNPAGLATVQNTQVLLNHYDYIADVNYEYGAVAMAMPNIGTVGAHISFLGMPDIERTTVSEPNGTGEMVGASSMTVGISYARFLTDRFSIGGTAKMIQEQIWHCSATGYAMDIGVLYRTFFKNIKIGMSISNFGSSLQMEGRDLLIQHDIDESSDGNNANINGNLATDNYTIPILFRVGISSNLSKDFLGLENHDFIVAIDAVHPNDNYEYVNAGLEYQFRQLLAVRVGHRQLFLVDREGGLSLGFGLHLNFNSYDFFLDYAAVDFGRLDYLSKYSLILSF
ncbi:PorV/PorQ family protein [bacterium]|nr:MAG: PorV/PorQ family protein [bacterium]